MTLPLDDLDLLNEPRHEPAGVPLQLPVDDIDEDPQQPRTEFDPDKLQQLADSVARRGVLQAISVRPHPHQPQRWMVNFGARRLRASKMLGKPVIPAYVDAGADSYDQVAENEQREDLKPLELALFVQRRLALGETQVQIARGLGKSQPYVAYACALIDAPDWLMALYRQGKCQGMTELYHLRRLHGVAPQRVLAWAEQRASISRTDIQALKLELASAAGSDDGLRPDLVDGSTRSATDRATNRAIDNTTATEPPLAEPPPPEPVPDRSPTAPTAPGDRAPPQAQDRAPRTQATAPSATRIGLFARHGEHIVEIVLDVAPDAPGQVYVRRLEDDARLIAAASGLELIGFERIAQVPWRPGEGA